MSIKESVLKNIEQAISVAEIPYEEKERFIGLLIAIDMGFTFTINIHHNDKLHSFEAYRVWHNCWLGPYKGGFRIDNNLSFEESTGLAMLMTLKNALFNIPFGGSKGGIKANISTIDENMKEKLVREYMRKITPYTDEKTDIPGPDINTGEADMNTMFDEYCRIKSKTVYSIVTGKSALFMGTDFRKKATGYGVAYIIEEIMKDIFSKDKKIAIQGIGNVGINLFERLYQQGYKVYAVCDSKAGIYSQSGLNFKHVKYYKETIGDIRQLSTKSRDINIIDVEDFIGIDADILILAAKENAISHRNVDKVKANIIVEAANSPITADADDILTKKGKKIIPDIVANAGGVFVSYYEWLKGNGIQNLTDDYIENQLREKMINTYKEVKDIAEKKSITIRIAALAKALESLYMAAKMRKVL